MVVSDGSDGGPVSMPCQPKHSDDYGIEAEIQVVQVGSCGSEFGLGLRITKNGGYHESFQWLCSLSPQIRAVGKRDGDVSDSGFDFEPGGDWHTYQFSVSGNTLRAAIDGVDVTEADDNRYLNGGGVEIYADGIQLNVRSITVFAVR